MFTLYHDCLLPCSLSPSHYATAMAIKMLGGWGLTVCSVNDSQSHSVSCPCREVVTFNHFLEAAAEKEVQGKARLQDFIENLLQRVELAEKQLEYYQSQQASGFSCDTSEHMVSPHPVSRPAAP